MSSTTKQVGGGMSVSTPPPSPPCGVSNLMPVVLEVADTPESVSPVEVEVEVEVVVVPESLALPLVVVGVALVVGSCVVELLPVPAVVAVVEDADALVLAESPHASGASEAAKGMSATMGRRGIFGAGSRTLKRASTRALVSAVTEVSLGCHRSTSAIHE
jgi:hypothetical protein